MAKTVILVKLIRKRSTFKVNTMDKVNKKLCNAAYEGNLEKFIALLEQGADVHFKDDQEHTVLMRALQGWRSTKEARLSMLKELLQRNVDLDHRVKGHSGNSYCAVGYCSDVESLELLLDAGAVVDNKLAEDLMYRHSGNREIRRLLEKYFGQVPSGWHDSVRQLYNRIVYYEGNSLFNDILDEAIDFVRKEVARLRPVFENYQENDDSGSCEDSSELYALHRLNEALLLSFQTPRVKDAKIGKVSLPEYIRFWRETGLDFVDYDDFHPFFHEIVLVDQTENRESPPAIEKTVWPCLMLGNLLFSRAGVVVKAGENILKKELAENSTLYWSHWRIDRPCEDMSTGWGHNSQWATNFRRDYIIGDRLHYNIDYSKTKCKGPRYSITEEEKSEWCRFRCLVTKEHEPKASPYRLHWNEVFERSKLQVV